MSAAQVSAYPWFQQLPRLGSKEEFAALKRLLCDSDYTAEGICRRLDIIKLEGFSMPPRGGRKIENQLDALIALFFDCGFVEEAKLAGVLGDGGVALLDSLGLLARDPAPAGTVFPAAAILPIFGIYTVCDRGKAPDGSVCGLPPDVVYPAIYDTTKNFVLELPEAPCEAMLDLGTGTGVAAVLGASTARYVWATDITARAVRFADFTRRLAGIENMTLAEGDLYEPVAGLTFDRIVTHPPYVPLRKDRPRFVFADAGDDGEQIIRRVIEGLPIFLRPGGRFRSMQVATDREGESFEERIRSWLGPHADEFDVVLGLHNLNTISEFLAERQISGGLSIEATFNWLDLWERTRTESLVYAALLIERHREPRQPVTKRVYKGRGYTGRNLEWQLEWQKALRRPDRVEMLMESRPVAAPDLKLQTLSSLTDGEFRTEEFKLEVPGPYRASFTCERWLTLIVPACQGNKTWREHFEHAKALPIIRADVPEAEFAMLLGLLVGAGLLQLPDWRPA